MNAGRRHTKLGEDKRRKHHHWQAMIVYPDGDKFIRLYTNRKQAKAFAERQRKSPAVKTARVTQIS